MLATLSCSSRVQLFVILGSVAHQALLSFGFSRQEYWSGLPFSSPGHLPDPGIKPAGNSLPLSHPLRSLKIYAQRERLPIQYCNLENSGLYTVHGVVKSWTGLKDFHLSYWLSFPKHSRATPEQGLEPWTLRLKVWCSTDWATQAPRTHGLLCFPCTLQWLWGHF